LNCRSGFIILGNGLHTCIHKSPRNKNCSGLFHTCIVYCSFCCRKCKFTFYLFILQLMTSFVFSTCAYSNHDRLAKRYYLLFELCSGFFAGSALVCINMTWSPFKILLCSMPLTMLLSRIHCVHCCCLGHTRIYIFPYSEICDLIHRWDWILPTIMFSLF